MTPASCLPLLVQPKPPTFRPADLPCPLPTSAPGACRPHLLLLPLQAPQLVLLCPHPRGLLLPPLQRQRGPLSLGQKLGLWVRWWLEGSSSKQQAIRSQQQARQQQAGRQCTWSFSIQSGRQAGSSQVPAGINPRQDTQKEHAVHTCTPCEVVCWWQAARLCRLPENLPPVSCAAVGREYQAVPCAGGSPPFWPSTWVHVCMCACVHASMCASVCMCMCVLMLL